MCTTTDIEKGVALLHIFKLRYSSERGVEACPGAVLNGLATLERATRQSFVAGSSTSSALSVVQKVCSLASNVVHSPYLFVGHHRTH